MGNPEPLLTGAERPTRVRFVVLTFLCLLAMIFYLDRICISKMGPAIKAELGLDQTQLGYVFASFTIAYGLFQTWAGRLGDRFGSRGVLVAIVIWWSAFTALTGACTGLLMLMAVRFIFGAGESGAFPNCARIISRWFAPEGRGFPQGLMNTAALAGGAIAPITVTYTMEGFDQLGPFFLRHFGWAPVSWRWTFLIFGLLGTAWAVFFWRIYHDDPETHPGVNGAERALINRGRDLLPKHVEQPPVPWPLVLRSRNVWLMGFVISCSSFVSYYYFSWLPTYLQSGRGMTNRESGEQASLVLTGGAIGSALGGLLIDWLLRKTGRKRMRSFVGFAAMIAAGLALLGSLECDDRFWAGRVIAFAFFLMMLLIASWWAVVSDISGRHTATLFGMMNSMGVIGAAIGQVFFGWLADRNAAAGLSGRAQWDPGFYFMIGVLWVGAACWPLINPNRSAVEEMRPDIV